MLSQILQVEFATEFSWFRLWDFLWFLVQETCFGCSLFEDLMFQYFGLYWKFVDSTIYLRLHSCYQKRKTKYTLTQYQFKCSNLGCLRRLDSERKSQKMLYDIESLRQRYVYLSVDLWIVMIYETQME
ncbi:Hypothetical_protein [Hexamita inflata]|uniref:Hypothetical_protein n=1 Tax=Hexamita inflata TaxID=28002 RepID=A0AA86U313_9EUKA|nr:Hypothetical protein HINF_LOCUS23882 [Hexamita inflata]